MVYKCHLCSKKFLKKNILNRHLREKHLQGNIFRCNICQTCFSRKERLLRHLRSVHFNLKFKCPECDMSFVEKFKYREHVEKTHDYKICPKCKGAFKPNFTQNSEFPKHACMSTNKLYYCQFEDCQMMGITYSRLNFFLRHLQVVHEINDFEEMKNRIISGSFRMDNDGESSAQNSDEESECIDPKTGEPIELKKSNSKEKTPLVNCLLSKADGLDNSGERKRRSSLPQLEEVVSLEAGLELVNNINILCTMENIKHTRERFKKRKGSFDTERMLKLNKMINLGKR